MSELRGVINWRTNHDGKVVDVEISYTSSNAREHIESGSMVGQIDNFDVVVHIEGERAGDARVGVGSVAHSVISRIVSSLVLIGTAAVSNTESGAGFDVIPTVSATAN